MSRRQGKYISAGEAAKIAGVTPETIRNLCKNGALAYTKRGNLFYPMREDVVKYKDSIEQIHEATEDIEQLKDTILSQRLKLRETAYGQHLLLIDMDMFPKRIEAIAKTLTAVMDRYQDKETVLPRLQFFKDIYEKRRKWTPQHKIVYTLVNFDTTKEQDLERIYTLREMGYWAYIMVYDKEHNRDQFYKDIQRWVNNRKIFAVCPTLEDYLKFKTNERTAIH